MKLPVVDRFTLKDFLAVEGVAYFDALALRALADLTVAHFADVAVSTTGAPRCHHTIYKMNSVPERKKTGFLFEELNIWLSSASVTAASCGRS